LRRKIKKQREKENRRGKNQKRWRLENAKRDHLEKKAPENLNREGKPPVQARGRNVITSKDFPLKAAGRESWKQEKTGKAVNRREHEHRAHRIPIREGEKKVFAGRR